MSYEVVRSAVVGILSGVAGMGVVHAYERHATEWAAFLNLFKHSGKINGWIVTRKSVPVKRIGKGVPAASVDDRGHQLLLRGYYGVNDADGSELVFQDLVDAVLEAFRVNVELNGTVYTSGPIQVEAIEPRLFGTVLCHVAELSLETVERIGA